ncbi:MAG: M20/M25/M40 family metallo-hydrolase [Caldilineales bacterium]|nr:M20/M25/M40 family metallo-hydrolase [Caldilineales bacterium]
MDRNDFAAFAREMRLKYQDEIVRVMQDLVRIPTENTPPTGNEKAGQVYVTDYLHGLGLDVDMYEPTAVAELESHPYYWPGRDYTDRPNVSTVLPGTGGGRSLLLTGQMDTVALGENAWSVEPFGGEIRDGRLYGLGSVDMKGAMGAMLVLVRALVEQGIRLGGSLSYESVVDEEEAGVNSTIAGRLRHGTMDAAIIPEVTGLQVYPAARGALITDVLFTNHDTTWLDVGTGGEAQVDVVQQIGLVLTHLDDLRASRRSHPVPALYQSYPDPMPVQVTKIYAGGWGSQVPIAVPPDGKLELIAQTLPGERREDVLGEVQDWLDDLVRLHPTAFATRPELHFRRRWMVPTSMAADHALVTALVGSTEMATGRKPDVLGAPYPCDLFALQHIFGMPGVIFGPAGGNAHAADEYVELDSVFAFWESLLAFVMRWCEAEVSRSG